MQKRGRPVLSDAWTQDRQPVVKGQRPTPTRSSHARAAPAVGPPPSRRGNYRTAAFAAAAVAAAPALRREHGHRTTRPRRASRRRRRRRNTASRRRRRRAARRGNSTAGGALLRRPRPLSRVPGLTGAAEFTISFQVKTQGKRACRKHTTYEKTDQWHAGGCQLISEASAASCEIAQVGGSNGGKPCR